MEKKRRKRLEDFIAPFRVEPGRKVTLAKTFDPAFKAGIEKKKDGKVLLEEGVRLLSEYQARLAAQDTWGVLVVIQGLKARGVTMIIVEQSVNVGLAIADRAVFMEKGEVRFEGAAEDLLLRDDLLRAVFFGSEGG